VNILKYLATPRWFGWLALVLVLAAACTALGLWQLDRRDQAAATMSTVQANYDRAPIAYSPALFDSFDEAREWTPVTLVGEYDQANQRIVRNRPLNGQPGYEVLVPLKLQDGTAVIINRGWLPIGNDRAGRPDTVPPAPDGEVTVVARIRPAEPVLDRSAPEGQLASIDLAGYREQLGYPISTAAYGLLATETPAPSTTPVAPAKPAIDLGPHLSYSMQWFAFGVLLFVGLGYAARQQYRIDHEDEGALPVPARARRRPSGEEEEDAILDAQGL
jgi:cytochrome oxidase assembly protein ShyY1